MRDGLPGGAVTLAESSTGHRTRLLGAPESAAAYGNHHGVGVGGAPIACASQYVAFDGDPAADRLVVAIHAFDVTPRLDDVYTHWLRHIGEQPGRIDVWMLFLAFDPSDPVAVKTRRGLSKRLRMADCRLSLDHGVFLVVRDVRSCDQVDWPRHAKWCEARRLAEEWSEETEKN